MIEPMTRDHLDQIKEIHRHEFRLPNFDNCLYFCKKVFVEDGKVLGAGYIKLTSEASLVLNPTVPRLRKAEILKDLIMRMEQELDAIGLDDTHVFLEGPETESLKKILKRKFDFREVNGLPLYLPPR